MENERNGYRYSGHNFRKFYTVTDTATGEQFVALCSALDKSIYKRLRELMEADIKANRSIIGTLPAEKNERAGSDQAEKTKAGPKQDTQPKESDDDFWSAFGL